MITVRAQVMRNIKWQGFWSPYLQNRVDYQLSLREICAKNNIRKPLTAPIGHIPVPEGPFKHLMMDYVDMLHKVKGKRYMLVIIDRFSRWVEAIPSKDQGAGTVVKFLANEVIPRFGIPVTISSDNGPAFVGHVLRQVMQALRIKQRYSCVYHPKSQGIVERVNGILKAKINKICQDANLNWVDALLLALMCYRSQESRITHLSPHEMLTGRRMPVPQIRGQSEGPPLEALDLALKLYMQQLSVIHRTILEQEQAREPETAAEDQPVQAGDLVYIRRFRRRWNEDANDPFR